MKLKCVACYVTFGWRIRGTITIVEKPRFFLLTFTWMIYNVSRYSLHRFLYQLRWWTQWIKTRACAVHAIAIHHLQKSNVIFTVNHVQCMMLHTQCTIHAKIRSFHFKRHHRRHSTCMQTNMPYNTAEQIKVEHNTKQ